MTSGGWKTGNTARSRSQFQQVYGLAGRRTGAYGDRRTMASQPVAQPGKLEQMRRCSGGELQLGLLVDRVKPECFLRQPVSAHGEKFGISWCWRCFAASKRSNPAVRGILETAQSTPLAGVSRFQEAWSKKIRKGGWLRAQDDLSWQHKSWVLWGRSIETVLRDSNAVTVLGPGSTT
jgi:hypothetical protein